MTALTTAAAARKALRLKLQNLPGLPPVFDNETDEGALPETGSYIHIQDGRDEPQETLLGGPVPVYEMMSFGAVSIITVQSLAPNAVDARGAIMAALTADPSLNGQIDDIEFLYADHERAADYGAEGLRGDLIQFALHYLSTSPVG